MAVSEWTWPVVRLACLVVADQVGVWYVLQLQTYVQTVVSTGGGVMSVPENMQYLHAGLIIWLDMDVRTPPPPHCFVRPDGGERVGTDNPCCLIHLSCH